MLTISRSQLQTFDTQSRSRFVAELETYLAERNAQVLPRFPQAQRTRIVEIMIKRAQALGATWRSTIGLHADLMQSIAPNYHTQKDIAAALAADGELSVDQRLKTLVNKVPSAAWTEAEEMSSTLPMFHVPALDKRHLAERTAAALSVAVWEIPHEQIRSIAVSAVQAAKRFRFDGLADAPMVLTLWRALYGKDFNNPKVVPWAKTVLDERESPSVRLHLLRENISAEKGRWI